MPGDYTSRGEMAIPQRYQPWGNPMGDILFENDLLQWADYLAENGRGKVIFSNADGYSGSVSLIN